MGDDAGVRRFRESRDLSAPGNAADDADIRPDKLDRVAGEQHLEIPDRGHAFASGDRDADLLRNVGHLVEIVREDRILHEQRVEDLDGAPELDGLEGHHPPVDLDAEIHARTGDLAVAAHRLDSVADLLGVGLEIGLLAPRIEERRQMGRRR